MNQITEYKTSIIKIVKRNKTGRHKVTKFAGLSNSEMFSETYGCITSKYASFIIFNSKFQPNDLKIQI